MADTTPEPMDGEEPRILHDGTLGGYLAVHDRPPAFEGSDGHPYTVSVEVERTGDLRTPFVGYLVFPRWAATGLGIIGHVESDTLARARTPEEAETLLGRLTLHEVRAILETALSTPHADTTSNP